MRLCYFADANQLVTSSFILSEYSYKMRGLIRLTFGFAFLLIPPENEPVLQKFNGLCAAKFGALNFRGCIVLQLSNDGGAYSFFDNHSALCVFKFFRFADPSKSDNHSAV